MTKAIKKKLHDNPSFHYSKSSVHVIPLHFSQIWFLNTRARESRKHRSSPRSRSRRRINSNSTTSVSPSTYIPIVPNPYAVLHHYRKYSSAAFCQAALPTPPAPLTLSTMTSLALHTVDQPLDLSIHKLKPPRAHEHPHLGQAASLVNPGTKSLEDQALNLSSKNSKQETVSPLSSKKSESSNHSATTQVGGSSRESTPKSSTSSSTNQQPLSLLSVPNFLHMPDPDLKQQPAVTTALEQPKEATGQADTCKIQHSEIFRYLTQKGLFKSGLSPRMDAAVNHKLPPSLVNPTILAQITGFKSLTSHFLQADGLKAGIEGLQHERRTG